MKKILSVLMLSAILLTLAGCASSGGQSRNVALEDAGLITSPFQFAEESYDFGVIKQSGGKVTHDFTFVYEGSSEVTITSVQTSCACTTAEVDRKTFKPGEQGVLTVTFNPNLHEEPEERFYKMITFVTDPPVSPSPEVRIWVEIDLDLGPDAYEVNQSQKSDVVGSQIFEAEATVDYLDVSAVTLTQDNIHELDHDLPDSLPLNEKTVIFVSFDNHRDNLGDVDLRNSATLDGNPALGWTVVELGMGGHHLSGLLIFPKVEIPQELVITGLEAGEARLRFSPSTNEE